MNSLFDEDALILEAATPMIQVLVMLKKEIYNNNEHILAFSWREQQGT